MFNPGLLIRIIPDWCPFLMKNSEQKEIEKQPLSRPCWTVTRCDRLTGRCHGVGQVRSLIIEQIGSVAIIIELSKLIQQIASLRI